MEYQELILKRRSVRKYKDKEVPKELIIKLIKESTYAPSSGNEQPWRFIVVRDQAFMKAMSDEAKNTILNRIALNPNDYAKKYEKMLLNEQYHIFYHAPAVVFIVGDKKLKNTKVNCALAASYFMLSATSLGLGTCWINFATAIESPEMLQTLGIGHEDDIVAPIIVGYPENVTQTMNRHEPDMTFI
ncbi:nitroreductase [Vallitalea pronyensis]|uniref:Nitroreductase n=1 Tax=Vallitalea pronyensis TaxID=1348613 RepID=A0A8J8MIB8_9FIRM|nr:nitroreductase [Vallitalea pronyensis]QUI22175.1 nitroreductase [Vallitalea pronyensis]